MPYKVGNIVRKEKLLDTSNFSFSHNVFHSYLSLVRQNAALCGNGLTRVTWNNLQSFTSVSLYLEYIIL